MMDDEKIVELLEEFVSMGVCRECCSAEEALKTWQFVNRKEKRDELRDKMISLIHSIGFDKEENFFYLNGEKRFHIVSPIFCENFEEDSE
jgi:hypothetical protein